MAVGSVTHRLKIDITAIDQTLGSDPEVDTTRGRHVRAFTHRRGFFPGVLNRTLHRDGMRPVGIVKIVIPRFMRCCFVSILSNVRRRTETHKCHIVITRDGRECSGRITVYRSFCGGGMYNVVMSRTGSAGRCTRFRGLVGGNIPLIFCSEVYANIGYSQIMMSSCVNTFATIARLISANYGGVTFCNSPVGVRVSGGHCGNCRSTLIGRKLARGPS